MAILGPFAQQEIRKREAARKRERLPQLKSGVGSTDDGDDAGFTAQ